MSLVPSVTCLQQLSISLHTLKQKPRSARENGIWAKPRNRVPPLTGRGVHFRLTCRDGRVVNPGVVVVSAPQQKGIVLRHSIYPNFVNQICFNHVRSLGLRNVRYGQLVGYHKKKRHRSYNHIILTIPIQQYYKQRIVDSWAYSFSSELGISVGTIDRPFLILISDFFPKPTAAITLFYFWGFYKSINHSPKDSSPHTLTVHKPPGSQNHYLSLSLYIDVGGWMDGWLME